MFKSLFAIAAAVTVKNEVETTAVGDFTQKYGFSASDLATIKSTAEAAWKSTDHDLQ